MFRLIGAASGWGAQIRECEEGPEILKEKHLLERLQEIQIPISDFVILYPKKRAKEEHLALSESLPVIHDFNLRLAKEVQECLEAHEFPIILGGDHSIAVGTWNGVYQFFKKIHTLPMGLIWIDAHMDAHTTQTTPSGAWHGMPIAGLLGHGDPKMADLMGHADEMAVSALLGGGDNSMSNLLQKEPVLLPSNLCLIGSRSFEEGEVELLQRLNVRIFFAEEVKKIGMEAAVEQAIDHVSRHTKAFGVSLDLDVITPEEAPGVGSPEEGGITTKELLKGISILKSKKKFKAFELVEYNPKRNHFEKTANICFEILKTIMK